MSRQAGDSGHFHRVIVFFKLTQIQVDLIFFKRSPALHKKLPEQFCTPTGGRISSLTVGGMQRILLHLSV